MPDPKSAAIEDLEAERTALRLAAIHLAARVLADAVRGGGTSQEGALLDLESAALRYVRRLDDLAGAPERIVH